MISLRKCYSPVLFYVGIYILIMRESIHNLVRKSRSIRRFQENRRIPDEILTELVDTARFCPSAGNRQPLRYIISSDPEETALIQSSLLWAMDLPDWDGPAEGERPSAYITIVTERDSIPDPRFDVGIAAQTIMLAAAERGFGGCIIGSVQRDVLSQVLSLPKQYEIQLVLAIGYPAESVLLEPLGDDGDTRYWRDADDVHHVPKRSLSEILIMKQT
ncbi:MAG: nitroreductase family protein [Methanogenium sp.]|nr:nitroreductase family protein [Methanogenium sp.]